MPLLSVFRSLGSSRQDGPAVAGQVHSTEIDDPLLYYDGPVQEGEAGGDWGSAVIILHVGSR